MITVVVGKEIEKIKGDFESYLNGLNMVGEISYSQYSELYDEGVKQIQRAYELGKSELEKENKGLWTCLICGKTYAPMWFEEIKIGNSPIRYCKWCRESVMENIIKNKLEQLK